MFASDLPKRRIVVEVIDDATAATFRAMTPAQRVAIACENHMTAKAMLMAHLRVHWPEWSGDQIREEVLKRMTRESK